MRIHLSLINEYGGRSLGYATSIQELANLEKCELWHNERFCYSSDSGHCDMPRDHAIQILISQYIINEIIAEEQMLDCWLARNNIT